MRPRLFTIVAMALALLVGMPATVAAESDLDSRALREIEAECEVPPGVFRIVDGFTVFVAEALVRADGAADYREKLKCLFSRLGDAGRPDRLVLVSSEAEVPNAVETKRRVADDERLRPEREARLKRLLIALRSNDRAAIDEAGVIGVPYVFGYSWASESIPATAFTLDSLGAGVACLTETLHRDVSAWYWVLWECPEGFEGPWESTETSFRFEGLQIAEIRTAPGPPTIMMVPAEEHIPTIEEP